MRHDASFYNSYVTEEEREVLIKAKNEGRPAQPLPEGFVGVRPMGDSPSRFNVYAEPGVTPADTSRRPVDDLLAKPGFKCPNEWCKFESTSEGQTASHAVHCKREHAEWARRQATNGIPVAGMNREEIQKIVVETMKPVLTTFMDEMKAAMSQTFTAATVPPPEKKRMGRPPGARSKAHRKSPEAGGSGSSPSLG